MKKARIQGPLFPRLRGAAWLLLAALLLTGCSGDGPWRLKDISGLMPRLAFTMTSHTGETVHGSDFRGKVTLVYFGFTHCPDVCPATLATVRQALDRLDVGADRVRVLFVTVDPARDTREVLRSYVNAFGPRFVGLRGSEDRLEALAKRYRVAYGHGEPDRHGSYDVSHSSGLFVFDRRGYPRLLALPDDEAPALAHDLRHLLESGGGTEVAGR
ncbi:SCO family protein [Thiohalorhabdus sp. Cl-TMA]|uniref:SCO family protein n=1 Tax=Thiohalorhabdus methylotrophus TaxID=3242694 RepID=A0ABV4TUH5_9GAMM